MSRWIAVAVLLASLTGCAGRAGTPEAVAPSTSDSCAAGTDQTITEADNGAPVCIHLGRTLTVRLGGGAWLAPTETGTALRPVEGSTPPAFTAVAAGTAEITSSRPNCPSPGTGQVACHSMLAFQVTVTVR
jgi:hypothetical protein